MQVVALNKIILNIFRNYVPNKYITIDDKVPVWMNEANGRFESDFVYLKNLIIELKELISSTKALYDETLEKVK